MALVIREDCGFGGVDPYTCTGRQFCYAILILSVIKSIFTVDLSLR